MFIKTTVAPIKAKALPSLELMAIFLAFKCMKTLFKCFPLEKCNVNAIFMAPDAQVVLSWLTKSNVIAKSIINNYRSKETKSMMSPYQYKFAS